jgi:hypothetical protein
MIPVVEKPFSKPMISSETYATNYFTSNCSFGYLYFNLSRVNSSKLAAGVVHFSDEKKEGAIMSTLFNI